MNKIRKILSWIPEYSRIPLIFALTVNMAVYAGARMIAGNWHHYNMETSIDGMIPFWPPSVVIYLGCYLFWLVNYILIARQDKKEVCRFFTGDFTSRMFCLAFFLILPTTNTRPVVPDTGFWNRVMQLVYTVDAADNLFPSIHCLVSWFCYIGIKDRSDIPVWYRGFSGVMAVLVCISTLTTKQHVIADVAGGIFLAEICFRLGKYSGAAVLYERVLDWINGICFGKRKGECCADEEKSVI